MNIITTLQDGTTIYRNPFAQTEAWFLPERKYRPSHTSHKTTPKPLHLQEPQNYCAFCPTNYRHTTPEKSRVDYHHGEWHLMDAPEPQHIFTTTAEFRRIGNLYEIISMSYWQKNYDHKLTPEQERHKEMYLADPKGREHIQSLLAQKFHAVHRYSQSYLHQNIDQLADVFFGGAHDLIIPRRHYIDNATDQADICATGDLTVEEHFQYVRLTCHSIKSIYENNPFVKYVGVYTNWRRDAGASFEHLHRQVIGVDRIGFQIQNGLKLVAQDSTIYEKHLKFVASDLNLILCENEYAVAFVDVGHTFSSIAIYSKSAQTFPWQQSSAELRGMSDIIHAVHAAFGRRESLNEEWYYQPPQSLDRMPWYVLIRWRNHRHAGIESITDIYPDEYGPVDLKNILLGALLKLRSDGKIARLLLDSECHVEKCVLNYHQKREPISAKDIKTT